MSTVVRFLGFAFASADMLVEVDAALRISFAAGALNEFAAGSIAPGQEIASLFAPVDAIKVKALFRDLPLAGRLGPIAVRLTDGRTRLLSLCRLPQDGEHIFCTLSHPGSRRGAAGTINARTGLIENNGFLQLASQLGTDKTVLLLVDIHGFGEALVQLSSARAERLLARLGAVLRGVGCCGAGQLGPSTFGVICPAGGPVHLDEALRKVLDEEELGHLQLAQCAIDLSDDELSAEQRLLAVRHSARVVTHARLPSQPRLGIGQAFAQMVDEVDGHLRHLTETVLKSHLHVVVMPIIRLSDGVTVHHRTDAHLDLDLDTKAILDAAELVSPADILDLALVSRSLAALAACADARLALNISGQTLASPFGCSVLCSFLAAQVGLCGRLKIIITGSEGIEDLDCVSHVVTLLQTLGIEVGLAETGSGAELLRWLPEVHLDFVSFDRSLVQRLDQGTRQPALVRGLVTLCRELGVATIAEGVQEDCDLTPLRACGFEFVERLRPASSDAEFTQEMRRELDVLSGATSGVV